MPGDNLWRLPQANINGVPQLLFYNDESEDVFFKMGGLLYRTRDWGMARLPVTIAVSDILQILRGERTSNDLVYTPIEFNWPSDAAAECFENHFNQERKKGRDRQEEQHTRGGFPVMDSFAKPKGLPPLVPVLIGEAWSITGKSKSVRDYSDGDGDSETSETTTRYERIERAIFGDSDDSLDEREDNEDTEDTNSQVDAEPHERSDSYAAEGSRRAGSPPLVNDTVDEGATTGHSNSPGVADAVGEDDVSESVSRRGSDRVKDSRYKAITP